MARPSAYPNWATNVNYAGGPNVGTPTKVVPSAGRMADGWRNNDVPPAQEENYEMDLLNQWIQWLDAGLAANLATLNGLTGIPDGARVNVRTQSAYQRVAAGTAGASDGYWLVTSADGGQWLHPNWKDAASGKIAYVGPVPAETTTVATPAGRINKQFIPHGWFFEMPIPLQVFTTNSTTTLTNANGAVLATWDMGTLAATDYIYAHINAACHSGSAAGYEVGVYISNDNGATWALMTPYNGVAVGVPFIYDAAGTGAASSVDLSFVLNVSAGHNLVQLRAASIAAGVTTVSVGAGLIRVERT